MEIVMVSRREPAEEGYIVHLYRRYRNPMLAFAFSILKDKEEAKDVVATAFLKVLLANPFFASIENASRYLFIAVRNNCYDAIRKKANRNSHYENLAFHAATSELMETFLHENLYVDEWLEKEIDRLNPSSATIIRKSYLEEKKDKEIASEMNRTEGSVSVQKSKALKILRDNNPNLPKDLILCVIILMQLWQSVLF